MSNTPNNPPPQTPPPQTPPPQTPPPQTPPTNPLNFVLQLLPDPLRNLLANPLLAQFASSHPLITNLVIVLFLSSTGINILQFIQNPNEPKNDLIAHSTL